ncbi:MAG TPA: efflux RND transporter periplasmic adaptor subunit [Candidatus Cloacimonadota bacterium]|nr:efflux RND transporter periplasmic adaptor subunit [Candidatus Cloacimonadota bacterium]HPT72431.1 efflux RND transporter periplasmic adaptor subunit [Candidatus Cloacimonadota bacterium]
MKRILSIVLPILLLLSFTACVKKKEAAKNIEQLHKENGIPVRVLDITSRTFTQELKYNASLTGVEESYVKSMVGDNVVKVYAKVGDYVKKDQIIVSFPQDTPAAQYMQANTAYYNAKLIYERMQRLFSQGAISQQDLDNTTAAYKVAQANFNSASQMVNVKAPISGYITAMKVSPADHVGPGDDLFTVSNTSKYKAIIWVPDTEIQYVKKGQKATSQFGDQTLTGRVTSVSLAMDQDKKAFKTEIVFDTHPKQVISGITLDIALDIARIDNAIVVDRNLITEEAGQKYVWLEKDNKAVKTAITTGHDNGIEYEVVSGLNVGDHLITEGINLLTDNCLVQVVK